MAVLTAPFAASRPDDLALADDTGELTWRELDERVNRLIHRFREVGIDSGDTIAVVAGNCNEWFEIAFACSNAGITFIPVNWHLVAAEIAYLLGDSGSKALICGHQFVDAGAKALLDDRTSGVEIALVIGAPATGRFESYDEFVQAGSPDEPADQSFGGPMFYTSGTTGHPKGVRGTLASMPAGSDPAIWQLIGGAFSSLVEGDGRTVLCGPFYHSAQWAYSFLPMITGSATIMQHKYDSAEVLRLIDEYGATNVHLVPTQMKRLVDLPAEVKERVRRVVAAARPARRGAVPAARQAGDDRVVGPGHHRVLRLDGGLGHHDDRLRAMAGQGRQRRRSRCRGWRSSSSATTGQRLGPNEHGTLYFRNAMGTDFEYHNAPEKTADVHLEPGVFTTGDVGYLDDDGYPVVERPQDRHDHLGRGQHLPGRDRGRARRPRCGGRGRRDRRAERRLR